SPCRSLSSKWSNWSDTLRHLRLRLQSDVPVVGLTTWPGGSHGRRGRAQSPPRRYGPGPAAARVRARRLHPAGMLAGPSGRPIPYGEPAAGVRRVAAGLAARGFGKGDVFAIFSPNLPEY